MGEKTFGCLILAAVLAFTQSTVIVNSNVLTNSTKLGFTQPPPPTLVQYYSQSQTGQFQTNIGITNAGTFRARLANKTLAGNLLILAIQGKPNTGTSCSFATTDIIDDQSNTWIAGPTANNVTDNKFGFIFYVPNVAAGTRVIQIKNTSCGSGHTDFFEPVAAEYANVATSSPADGSSSNTANTATSVTAGSFTPGTSGDLLFQVVFRTSSQAATSFTAGTVQSNTTWTLLTADILVGTSIQTGVQSAAGAINPTMTMAAAADYMSLAIAFKPAAAGTLATTNIHIAGEVHENLWQGQGTTQTIQWPTVGKCLIITELTGSDAYHVNSITDDASDTWNNTGARFIGSSSSQSQIFYATNATPANRTLTITWNATSPGHGTLWMRDVSGVTGCNFDTDVTGQGNQTVFGNITGVTITPTSSPGLVVTCIGIDFNTVGNFTSASQFFTSSTFDGETTSGPDDIDENNGDGHYYNPDLTAVTFTWSLFFGSPAAGTYAGRAATFH